VTTPAAGGAAVGGAAVGGGPVGASGRDPAGITVEAVRDGLVDIADVRIHPATLEHQAQVAEQHANPQLAENFRRAAELTALPDDEVLALYEALRPSRSTGPELEAHADRLDAAGAHRNAALFREAARVYERRGLLRR
jgi:propanediol dehydratase small subunit